VSGPRVGVVTDSSADLGPIAAAEGIEVVPLTVRFGGEEYLDGVDLTDGQFYQKLATSTSTPVTAQPSPAAFAATYRRLMDAGAEGIVSIHISSSLSGTVNAARLGAAEVDPDRIAIIDSRTATAAMGLLAIDAARRARSGESRQSIAEAIAAEVPKVELYATIPSLTYLARGGRIGNLAGLVGNVLKIVPILTVQDGVVKEFAKVRTFARAVDQLMEIVTARLRGAAGVRMAVIHSMAPELAKSVSERLSAAVHATDIFVCGVGPTVGTHAGPGAVGVCFIV